MKHQLVYSLLCLFAAAGALRAQNASAENTDIRLHVDGLPATWVHLQGIHENVKSQLDSAQLDAAGDAVFKYDFRLEPGYYEIILPGKRSLPVLLDRDQTLALSTRAEQPIEAMRVSGSLENSLLYNSLQYDANLGRRFQTEVEALQAEGAPMNPEFIDSLRQKYFSERQNYLQGIFKTYPDALFTTYEQARQTPAILHSIMTDPSLDDTTRQRLLLSHFWDNVDFTDERLLRTPIAFDKLWAYMNQYVPDQTDVKIQAVDILLEKLADYPAFYKFFARWLAEDYMPPFNGQMDPDALYIHIIDNYLTAERAFWADSVRVYAWNLRARDMRVSLAGMPGASFQAKGPDGKEYALDEIEAPYIALFFYHADCEHCIETTPKLVELYRRLKDQGLEIVAVAMSTADEEWKTFIQKNNMDWINVTDEGNRDIYKKYFVRATPEIYLLGPQRQIIGKHLGVEDIPLLMHAAGHAFKR